jgi:hypothetical protein
VLVPNFRHHLDAAGCTDILRRAHAALAPKGRVAVVEWVPDEDRISLAFPVMFTMTMLFATPAGTTYTVSELNAMLAHAGFVAPQVTPLAQTPMILLLSRVQ